MKVSSKVGLALAALIVLFSLSMLVMADSFENEDIAYDEEKSVLLTEGFEEAEEIQNMNEELINGDEINSYEYETAVCSTEIIETETTVEYVAEEAEETTSGNDYAETEIYTEESTEASAISVIYRIADEKNVWTEWASDGAVAMVSDKATGMNLSVEGNDEINITYAVYNSTDGWSNWTAGEDSFIAENVEAVRITLNGTYAENYNIYYSAGLSDGSWTVWAQDKEAAGSLVGTGTVIKALKVKIVPAGTPFDISEGCFSGVNDNIYESTAADDRFIESESEAPTEAISEASTESVTEPVTESCTDSEDKDSTETSAEISSEAAAEIKPEQSAESVENNDSGSNLENSNLSDEENTKADGEEETGDVDTADNKADEEIYEGTFHIKTEEDESDIILVNEEGAAYTNITSSSRGNVSAVYAYPNVHINTGNRRSDLIKIAAGQVGYYRKEGTNTKYGVWYGYPNSAWCAMFVSWCSDQAGISSNIIKPFCRCSSEATWFKGKNKWKNPAGYTPKEGDIIFFHYNGSTINHVGIVTGAENGYVYCIEGNHSNAVDITRHKLTASYIAGYGTPDYPGKDAAQVKYKVHLRSYGWLDWVLEGKIAGTTGESRRMEAVQISLTENAKVSGGISYRVHVRSYGWLPWVKNGAVCGTTGESRRMEAIEIVLTGDMAKYYDIYYRAHVRSYGWLDWAKNGGMAGTSGMYLRLEALEIELVEKGGKAPGSTKTPYYVK